MIDTNSKFYFKKDIEVRYSEMDYRKILKPSAMLNFLQDLAANAADNAHFGYKETKEKNLGWFVVKYHMEFNNYPQNIYNIVLKTEARGANRLFALRDFEIYEKDTTNLLGRVTSNWTLVDLADKSLQAPSKIFPFIKEVEKRDDDLSYLKIKPLERVDFKEEFKIRYDDIDVNLHVNNVNYIIWALEALPKEFKDKNKLKTLDIVFKKEIKYGNIILSNAQLDGKQVTIDIVNKTTNDVLCQVLAQYVEM